MSAYLVDVSSHQGKIDWQKMALYQPKVVGVFIRATVSWGTQDKWFPYNWAGTKAIERPRGAYHVVYPGEDPTRQIDNFFRVLPANDIGEFPPVLDCELDHGQTPAAIAANSLKQAQLIERRTLRKPIIYSRKGWLEQFLPNCPWLAEYDLWLALYRTDGLEHPGPCPAPKGVPQSRVIIHQTGAKGDGRAHGTESLNIDQNRSQIGDGSEAAFRAHFNLDAPVVVEPPAGPKDDCGCKAQLDRIEAEVMRIGRRYQ